MSVQLSADERKRLAAFVKKIGIKKASEQLGINRGTIANALGGLGVQVGTIAVIQQKLDSNEKDGA